VHAIPLGLYSMKALFEAELVFQASAQTVSKLFEAHTFESDTAFEKRTSISFAYAHLRQSKIGLLKAPHCNACALTRLAL